MDWFGALAALGGGAFVVASCVVGMRLVLLALRTRGLPELTMGWGLLLMGGLGYPLSAIARAAADLPLDARSAMLAANWLFNLVGMTGVAVFTWRVFRPESRWAPVGVVAISSGIVAADAIALATTGLAAEATGQVPPPLLRSVLGVVTLVWAGAESLRYHLLMRRRQALGLADPVVSDRFRLWAVGMLCAASISALSLALQLVGIQMMATPGGSLVVGGMGLISAGAVSLAFFPPRAYEERIRARAVA